MLGKIINLKLINLLNMYFLVKIHFIGLFDLKIFCKKVKPIQKLTIV